MHFYASQQAKRGRHGAHPRSGQPLRRRTEQAAGRPPPPGRCPCPGHAKLTLLFFTRTRTQRNEVPGQAPERRNGVKGACPGNTENSEVLFAKTSAA